MASLNLEMSTEFMLQTLLLSRLVRAGTLLTRPYYATDDPVPRYGPALGRRKDSRSTSASFRYP